MSNNLLMLFSNKLILTKMKSKNSILLTFK